MPVALMLLNTKEEQYKFKINFELRKKGRSSCTYIGRYPFHIENDELGVYIDDFGNEYTLTIPEDENIRQLLSIDNIICYHDNFPCRFRKPKHTWYFKVKFRNPELKSLIEVIALYDGSLTPLDIDNRLINF